MKYFLFTISLFLGLLNSFAISLPPTGNYNIGSKTIYIVDSTRSEILTKDQNDFRKLILQVFYPCKFEKNDDCGQFNSPYGKRFKYNHCLNSKFNDTISNIPIVILSPGLGGSFLMNASLAEEIASHGYYVINIGHSYFNSVPTFPDGSIIELFGIDTLMINSDNVIGQEFRSTLNKYIKIESDDISTVIKKLSQIIGKEDSNSVDFNNIACIGYSAGGAAATEYCTQNKMIKACININGVLYGDSYKNELSSPFLYVNADYKSPKKAEIKSLGGIHIVDSLMQFYENRKASLLKNTNNDFYELTLTNTTHHNFSDWALIDKSFCGKANPKNTLEITYSFILSFLEKYLKGTDWNTEEILSSNRRYEFEIKKQQPTIPKLH